MLITPLAACASSQVVRDCGKAQQQMVRQQANLLSFEVSSPDAAS